METIYYPADMRGFADHGWLQARHTFSFASYFNRERMNFGVLRVLNDDIVQGGMGFGMHPHDNMEIITIPLEGALRHSDNMGNGSVIGPGEVQVMSAGTGLFHSEMNHSKNEPVKVLQIWVLPERKGVQPRYDQKVFDTAGRKNQWQTVVSPKSDTQPGSLWIHQQAYFQLGDFDGGQTALYQLKNAEHGVFLFVIEGEVAVGAQPLRKRDGLGITDAAETAIQIKTNSQLLLMELPLVF